MFKAQTIINLLKMELIYFPELERRVENSEHEMTRNKKDPPIEMFSCQIHQTKISESLIITIVL